MLTASILLADVELKGRPPMNRKTGGGDYFLLDVENPLCCAYSTLARKKLLAAINGNPTIAAFRTKQLELAGLTGVALNQRIRHGRAMQVFAQIRNTVIPVEKGRACA
jgi:hypothetical protein